MDKLFIIIGLLLSFLVVGQETEASHFLTKMQANYSTEKDFGLEFDYKMFSGINKDKITEAYTSKVYKKDKVLSMELDSYQTYFYNDFQLSVDNSTKNIYINPKSLDDNPLSFMQQFEFIKSTFSSTIVSQTNSKVVLDLTAKGSNGYLPYNKIQIELSLPECKINRQSIYFEHKIPFKDEKGKVTSDYGVLEISLKELPTIGVVLPLFSDLVIEKDNTLVPIGTYSNYKITDQRN